MASGVSLTGLVGYATARSAWMDLDVADGVHAQARRAERLRRD